MRTLALILALIAAVRAGAEEPTELYDCVDDADGPGFCSDSTAVLVDQGCNATFNRYYGRIAWPVLRNIGPVTISVKTRLKRFTEDPPPPEYLPLYVEVVGRTFPGDDYRCRNDFGGIVVLVAQGGPNCGGMWESVGPIDLASFGVPLGALYHIQLPFFESRPSQSGRPLFHTIGFSCISITSHPLAVARTTWSTIKVLYR